MLIIFLYTIHYKFGGTELNEFNVLEHINKLCEVHGWTYYRLAQEADVPYSTLTNMMKRNTIPSIPTLERLCYAFGITLSEFFIDMEPNDILEQRSFKHLISYWSKISNEDQELLLSIAKRLAKDK